MPRFLPIWAIVFAMKYGITESIQAWKPFRFKRLGLQDIIHHTTGGDHKVLLCFSEKMLVSGNKKTLFSSEK